MNPRARFAVALACVLACAKEDPKQAIARLEKSGDVDALAKTYASGNLDDKTRADLIAWLAKSNDVRAAPAFAKALDDCDKDIEPAAHATAALANAGKSLDASGAAAALFACFSKYKASSGSITVASALHEAVLAVKDPSYPAKAAAMLEAPVNPADSLDARGVHRINDALDVWQNTALEMLIATPDKDATRVLVAVLMTRNKRSLWPLARAALAATARDSVPVLRSALDASDPEYAKLRADWARDRGDVPNLVEALAECATDRARDAIVGAVPSITSDANRAALAESLTWFARNDAVIVTFESIESKLPLDHVERAALLQAAGDLGDPKLFSWALDEGKKSGSGEQAVAAKAGAIESAIKLMQPGDEPLVLAAIDVLENKSGLSPSERDEVGHNIRGVYAAAASAVTQCKVDVACHVAILRETIPPDAHANWKQIKAATMCALFGNDETRKELVAIAQTTKNPGARLAIARAIDQLAPRGDLAAAKTLEAVATRESLAVDDPIARVARMIHARAAP